jgi:hypothetical protein
VRSPLRDRLNPAFKQIDLVLGVPGFLSKRGAPFALHLVRGIIARFVPSPTLA